MVNRRNVLKIGAATVAGALVKVPVSGRNESLTRTHFGFHRAVFDERFAECRGFAAELYTAGVFTSGIQGDISRLWYEDLRVHLRANRLPVVGLTNRAALFCLEELARDVDMRVIFRADHLSDQTGVTEHSAVGPASLVAVARDLPPEAGFGRAVAVLFSQFDINEPRDIAALKRTGPFPPENGTALVSWLIA
jgi:TAT (twin-arginine translocation) pathway signal sequence